MSAKDVIKSSVYESFLGNGSLTVPTIFLILGISTVIGLYIFWIYKSCSQTDFYSKDLNTTIAGMPIVVAAIMIAMQTNLIVSLGMVGALSIVRFRNAVKNPLDLLFLFWAVSSGIICGVGLYVLSIILCIIMTILILLLQMIPNAKGTSVLLLRTWEENVDWDEINKIIFKYGKNVKEKSNSYRNGETEVIYELTTSAKTELLSALRANKDLTQINFLSHDGEYRI
ncbi:MAG: DUF4956 domain-containing protein [Lachnospiraceae bacterium]|nr:DUF4956 domain-containing protein [Lachnospiraceae bacterium]